MHILSNISRSKGNQTIKFDLLIEYKKIDILPHKSCGKQGGKTIPRPFLKKSNRSIALDQQFKVLYSLFFIVCQGEGYQNIKKLSCKSLAFTSNKASLKTKSGLELVSKPHFLHDF